MTVFTTRFALNNAVGAVNYVVPAGKRAVVKACNWGNDATTPGAGALYVDGALLITRTVPVGTGVDAVNQTIAVEAGGNITLYNSQARMASQVSGFLFDV